jgi:hypothetical protein
VASLRARLVACDNGRAGRTVSDLPHGHTARSALPRSKWAPAREGGCGRAWAAAQGSTPTGMCAVLGGGREACACASAGDAPLARHFGGCSTGGSAREVRFTRAFPARAASRGSCQPRRVVGLRLLARSSSGFGRASRANPPARLRSRLWFRDGSFLPKLLKRRVRGIGSS